MQNKPQVYLARLMIGGQPYGASWVAEANGKKYAVGRRAWKSALRIATNESTRSICVPTSAHYERVNAR